MKIAHIEVFAIRAPRKEPVRSGRGTRAITASEFGIVRIETDTGCEGLGEISITSPQIGFSLCHAARKLIAPALIGLDPLALPRVLWVVDDALDGQLNAPILRASFEMALLDIAGRHYGLPVYQLLGGKARECVPLAWSVYQKDPQQMAEEAVVAARQGFHAMKLKVGRQLSEDAAGVRAVGAALGEDVPLRLDANMAWRSVPEASAAIRALADKGKITWIEQPLGRANLHGMHLLRFKSAVPIMADESLQTLRDAYEVVQTQAADLFNVYICKAGGLMAAAQIFAFADAMDVPCIIGSHAELGIGTAAAAHLGVIVANLPYPCETFGPLRYEDDIVQSSPRIEHGYLYPPDGPGLGVSLDREVLRSWLVNE